MKLSALKDIVNQLNANLSDLRSAVTFLLDGV